jgi:uncharacterized protein (TIGR03790 family)
MVESSFAGLGPQNIVVVVDDAIPESVTIGDYYVQRRNIPACNVFHLNNADLDTWTKVIDNLATPLKQYLADEGLTDQIDVVVLTPGLPYRGGGSRSSTASLIYSEASDTWQGTCYLGSVELFNPYFGKAMYYDYNVQYEQLNVPLDNRRIVMMLNGFTIEDAITNIDSGVDSDETHPTGTVYFISAPVSSGQHRLYPRHDQIPNERTELASLGINSEHYVVCCESQASIYDKPDVLGYLTGATSVEVLSNTFLPGSFADHLTSFGGDLLNRDGQMSILEFTAAGAAGSAGTVTEPCNYWEKFPHAQLYTRYAAGFSLGEAVWMSVQQPWQTIMVGDPLASPFAVRPVVEINGPSDGFLAYDDFDLDLHVYHPRGDAISKIELYVDGKLSETIAEYSAAAGNEITLAVDDVEYTYVATGSETASDVLRDMKDNIPAPDGAFVNTPTGLNDIAYLRIRARTRGPSGDGVPYSITASQASGAYLGVAARQDGPVTVGGMAAVPDDDLPGTRATGHVYVSLGRPDVNIVHNVSVANLGIGEHELRVVAYEGDSLYTQGWSLINVTRVIAGDVNLDGVVNSLDIEPFIAVLTGTDTDPLHIAAADVNQDGAVNSLDIEPFIELLLGP